MHSLLIPVCSFRASFCVVEQRSASVELLVILGAAFHLVAIAFLV